MEKVNLQLKTSGIPNVLHLSQYDTDRMYVFTPYYGSEKYAYQTGAKVYMEATKPDKTVVVAEATYNTDGTVTYQLTEEFTQVAGDVRAKLTWVKKELRIASAEIIFACDAAGIDTYARISESDLELLHSAEEKMQELEKSVTAAATSAANAKTSETNAASSKTAAATSATNAKTSETNAATSAANAKTSETNAATSATNAKTSETNAASSKTSAASSATTSKNWAVGPSGTGSGTDTNNAKYYATQAAASAKEAASAVTGVKSLNSQQGDLTIGLDESNGALSIVDTVIGNVVTAVKNNIATIKTAIGNATTSAAGLMTAAQVTKLDGIAEGATKNTIDSALSTTSTNAVQNKVVTAQINSVSGSIAKRLDAQSLTAAGGSLTFTDSSITTTSLIDVYATIPNIAPSAITASAGTCTVTFDAQDSAFDVCITVRN